MWQKDTLYVLYPLPIINVDDLPPIEGDFTIYKASSVDGKPMSPQQQKGTNMLKPAGSISSSPANTQMNSGMALLYPAPCIIKAIPPCHRTLL